MESLAIVLLLLLNLLAPGASAWGNMLKDTYPNLQTMACNGTQFVVPVDKAIVAALIGSYTLLDISPDSTFPDGFINGKHPVVINSQTYCEDIQMGALHVDSLVIASITFPYVDGTKDGKTPCTYSYYQFSNPIIPAVAATLFFGTTQTPFGIFEPANAAYDGNGGYLFSQLAIGIPDLITLLGSQNSALAVLALTAPNLQIPVLDTLFQIVPTNTYPESTYQSLANQLLISNQGSNNCLMYKYFYNFPLTNTFKVSGTVNTYSPFFPKTAGTIGSSYAFNNAPGYSANVQGVNCGGGTCASLAAIPSSSACPTGLSQP